MHSYEFYDELIADLADLDAIKVATWWNTAMPVWRSSVVKGIPVYFVQDIETSYYPDDESVRHAVIDSYRPEFTYMTISGWNRERLRELGLDAVLIPPGIDLECFRARPEVPRREDMVLALGRTNPLKNLPLTIEAWRALPEPRPELCMFGIEPELATDEGMRYIESAHRRGGRESCSAGPPSSSRPPPTRDSVCRRLESMATGGAVVCTDAHGNRDFCDGRRQLSDARRHPGGRERRLWRASWATPSCASASGAPAWERPPEYAWERRIDALEAFLVEAARPRETVIASDVVPGQASVAD